MNIQTILITVLGGGVMNLIVSAVTNHFQGDDVGRCARSGLFGGLAGSAFGCLAYFLNLRLGQ